MDRIVVAHRGKRVHEPALQFAVEVRSRGEHAVIVGRRGPNLTKTAFRHQAFVPHRIPEPVADSARIGTPVEDGAHHFHFAGPGVTMFAYVAIEAKRPVVDSLAHALLLQKMNGKDRGVSAVAATNG